MIVKDLLETVGGNTEIVIRGTTEKDKYVDLWRGMGDDIKFPLIPYAKYEIEHTSVNDNVLIVVLDSSLNFAEINPKAVGMTAYIGNQVNSRRKIASVNINNSIPIEVLKKEYDGCGAEIQCDMGGRYSYEKRNAIRTILNWYNTPDYKRMLELCGFKEDNNERNIVQRITQAQRRESQT